LVTLISQMKNTPTLLDQKALRRYARRALRFDPKDNYLARRCGEELLDRLDLVSLEPDVILDLGCGAGAEAELLHKKYPNSLVLGLDRVLGESSTRTETGWLPCVADCAQLPLRDNSVDLIFANLILPWVDVPKTLLEPARVLKPAGLLVISTLGPDTLFELSEAWDSDERPHVHGFQDMHNFGDALVQAGFTEPVMDAEPIGLTYSDVVSLVRDLRQLGGTNAHVERRRSLTGKHRWQGFVDRYKPLARDNGRIRATFELVYGVAWARGAADGARESLRVSFEA